MNSKEAILYALKKGYRITREGEVLNPKGIQIRGKGNGRGYRQFSIRYGPRSEGKHVTIQYHRFQGYMKYGDRIFEKNMCVRHMNHKLGVADDKSDNSWDGVQLGTHGDNQMDQPKEVRIARSKKATSMRKDLIKGDIERDMVNDRKDGMSIGKIADKYGKSKGTLSYFFEKRGLGGVRALIK